MAKFVKIEINLYIKHLNTISLLKQISNLSIFHKLYYNGGKRVLEVHMASQKYILPNAAAIRKLLAQESDVTSAAIIRLAWQAGLTATEIVNLRWTDINFDNGTLSVSGRIVPASSDLISFYRQWSR